MFLAAAIIPKDYEREEYELLFIFQDGGLGAGERKVP